MVSYPSSNNSSRTALVVGSTGIAGGNLAVHLATAGWRVFGLARKPQGAAGVEPIAADLQSEQSVRDALQSRDITHVFICTWLRQDSEAENVRVNGEMIENLFKGLEHAKRLTHVALVTGTKQYLGPFEAYGQTTAETPFREDTPRLPGLNFYYTQEDVVFAAAVRKKFSWSVHRPHSLIGYALGNAMNMGMTLAVYASICRETGQPFVFPGSRVQWNALTDVTDAMLLAKHLEWASLTPQARNQAFNVVNGDVFRWRWLWAQLASYFDVVPAEPPAQQARLETSMASSGPTWEKIAAKHSLTEPRIEKLVSWWHTDGDLGREIECVNDMTKSRLLGFDIYQSTPASFFRLFDRLRAEKIIPA